MGTPTRTCAICQTLLADESDTRVCSECGTTFHLRCWEEIGGCGTQGCRNAPAFDKKLPPEESHWGATTKQCPMCRETIKATDMICPYCHERFDTADPLTIDDIRARAQTNRQPVTGAGPAVAIFICGLVGCTAPLNLIFGGAWFLKKRSWLREVAPTRHLLAVVGLALSALYILVMLAVLVCRAGGSS